MPKSILIFFIVLVISAVSLVRTDIVSLFLATDYGVVYADHDEEDEEEDDDDQHEEDEEDEKDDDDDDYEQTVEEETYEFIEVPVENETNAIEESTSAVYTTTIEAGYDKDSDGDKLVDALDPNPTIPEQDFFTDTDNDSIPDVLDEYPNEDDFLYVDFVDTNANGIADEFESPAQ